MGMTEEVLRDIYRIRIPLPENPLRELNSYLIRGKDKNLLIDTGFRMQECGMALREGLEQLGVTMENTDILLTHLHADHSGLAPDFLAPGRTIFISETDRRLMESQDGKNAVEKLQERHRNRLLAAGTPKELLEEMLRCNPARAAAPDPACHSYRGIFDGDVLQAGDYRLRCVETPGHTPGHMCFYIEREKAMFLGDHVLFDITPNISVWPDVADSLGDYLKSLDRMREFAVDIPLPAHRETGVLAKRIKELKRHHEARLLECMEIISSGGKPAAYEIAGKMSWKIRTANWEEFPPAQKWFAIGECFAHLDHLKAEGYVEEYEGELCRYGISPDKKWITGGKM